jgi:hypothetical protein
LYPAGGRKWLVEAQIEVLQPIFIESVALEPPDICTASAVAVAAPTPSAPPRWPSHLPRLEYGAGGYVTPGSQLRRVFEVVLKPRLVLPNALGKLTITWRGAFGELARFSAVLTRSQDIGRMPSVPDSIELKVLGVASSVVQLHKPFVFRCAATNKTQSNLAVRISFVEPGSRIDAVVAATGTSTKGQQQQQQQQQQAQAQTGMAVVGSSGDPQPVELTPGKEHEIAFTLLPLQPGIHRFGGLSFFDVKTNREHFFADLGSVLVEAQ